MSVVLGAHRKGKCGKKDILKKILQLKSGLKSDILIDERGELEGQDRQCSQLVGRGETECRGVLLFQWGVDSRLL